MWRTAWSLRPMICRVHLCWTCQTLPPSHVIRCNGLRWHHRLRQSWIMTTRRLLWLLGLGTINLKAIASMRISRPLNSIIIVLIFGTFQDASNHISITALTVENTANQARLSFSRAKFMLHELGIRGMLLASYGSSNMGLTARPPTLEQLSLTAVCSVPINWQIFHMWSERCSRQILSWWIMPSSLMYHEVILSVTG